MAKKAIIFDLDGTLLDTLEDLCASVNHALKTEGLPERTLEEVNRFVGNGMGLLIRRSAPEGTDGQTLSRLLDVFLAHYREHCADRTRAYPGIARALEELHARGYLLAVVTNKKDPGAKALCASLLPPVFSVVLGETEGLRRKPEPDMIERIEQSLGVTREDCIYIGDSDVDVMTAKNAGLPMIAVLWGFRTKEQLLAAGAKVFAETPADLLDLL